MHYELSYVNWAGLLIILVVFFSLLLMMFCDEVTSIIILVICVVFVIPPILMYTGNRYLQDLIAYTKINPDEVYVVVQKKETANTGYSLVLEDESGRTHIVEDIEKQVYDQYEVGSTLTGSSIEEGDSDCDDQ